MADVSYVLRQGDLGGIKAWDSMDAIYDDLSDAVEALSSVRIPGNWRLYKVVTEEILIGRRTIAEDDEQSIEFFDEVRAFMKELNNG